APHGERATALPCCQPHAHACPAPGLPSPPDLLNCPLSRGREEGAWRRGLFPAISRCVVRAVPLRQGGWHRGGPGTAAQAPAAPGGASSTAIPPWPTSSFVSALAPPEGGLAWDHVADRQVRRGPALLAGGEGLHAGRHQPRRQQGPLHGVGRMAGEEGFL